MFILIHATLQINASNPEKNLPDEQKGKESRIYCSKYFIWVEQSKKKKYMHTKV